MLFDEPTSALDPEMVGEMLAGVFFYGKTPEFLPEFSPGTLFTMTGTAWGTARIEFFQGLLHSGRAWHAADRRLRQKGVGIGYRLDSEGTGGAGPYI